MNPFRLLHSPGFRARGRRSIAACLAAALLASPAVLHTGCDGGTTGVDNPGLAELPVEFRDQAGDVSLAQGTLEIYDWVHNPAIDSEPLLRVEVPNRTRIRLTGDAFDRIDSTRASDRVAANAKRSAGPAGSDRVIRFNLVFRSASGSGAVATGLSYDPVLKVFSLAPGFSSPGGVAPVVKMLPEPLIRFAARIHREPSAGELGRVFLPGTPFQATLVDSDFALQNLPEGRFSMRLLGSEGYVYAVRETLDTRTSRSFTSAPDPIGRIDASIASPGFAVEAVGLVYDNPGESVALQGKLLGADSSDSRLAVLWRLLRSQSSDSARIAEPFRLSSQILFPTAGTYVLELSATLGATTVRDTAQYTVNPGTVPTPANFFAPLPGDSLKEGESYKIGWNTPISGLARLEYNYKDGAEQSWVLAADSLAIQPGGSSTLWKAPVIGITAPCLLRLRMIPSDSILAQTPEPFFLVP